MGRRNVSDEGFSLIEVMFAAFIAFFVLTAVFGLLVVSTRQGRVATQDVVATNLATLVVEQARSLPYASVGTSGTSSPEIPGVLPAEETTTFQSYTFTIKRSVKWENDPTNDGGTGDVVHDYKRLTVDVSWVGGHITPVVTFIREHTVESPEIPIVQFVHGPKQQGVIVFKDGSNVARVWAGDPANPDAYVAGVSGDGISSVSYDASASVVGTSGVVARVEYYVDNVLVSDRIGFPALWTGAASQILWPTSPFALNLDSTLATGPLFPDGMHVLRCMAYTAAMGSASDVRMFIVDNFPPSFASTVMTFTPIATNAKRANGVVEGSWQPAMDGNTACRRYDVSVQPAAGTASSYLWQDLGLTGSGVFFDGMPSGYVAAPFTAYRVRFTARSARGLTGSTQADSGWFPTAPRLTGSVFNRAANKKAPPDLRFDLTVTAPSASTLTALGASSVVYDVYEQAGPSSYTYSGDGNLPATALKIASDQSGPTFQVLTGNAYSKYYQVEAKLKNAAGTVIGTVRSNVVGAPTSSPTFQTSAVLAIP